MILFSLVIANNFYFVKNKLETLADSNRIIIQNDIEYTIQKWLEEKINNLESSEKHISKRALSGDYNEIETFLNNFENNNLYFDMVQAYIYKYYFYVNSKIEYDFIKGLTPEFTIENMQIQSFPWFSNTKKSLKTTMTIMEKHLMLKEKTINLCTPIIRDDEKKGILCGIIKVSDILNELKMLRFPKDAYFFISDKNGNILTELASDKKEIISTCFDVYSTDELSKGYHESKIDNDIVTIKKLKNFDWYIGVGIDTKTINDQILNKFTFNAIILFILFLFLLIIINSTHDFLRRRVEKENREYELMLAHKSRIGEIGELISGINHQLYQPINALSLLISSSLSLQKQKKLDEETLNENLIMCQKATSLMSNTIKVFRNFYRINDSISSFSLEKCINGILQVMHIEMSKNNINIEVKIVKSKKNIYSIENLIQQILLVLIQNAKEALLNTKKCENKIIIEVNTENEFTYIDVIDDAGGVSPKNQASLFTNMKSSTKDLGSGIGLYFAKRLATEKLAGDLTLHSSSAPTIFRLKFLSQLKKDGNE